MNGIAEGNGTKESPFLVVRTSGARSADIQREAIDTIFGKNTYQPPIRLHPNSPPELIQQSLENPEGIIFPFNNGEAYFSTRRYYESPRGAPKNQDLCEYKLSVKGLKTSVWFDLSQVTAFESDPHVANARAELRKSVSPAARAQIQKVLSQPPIQSKRSATDVAVQHWYDTITRIGVVLICIWLGIKFLVWTFHFFASGSR